MGGAIYLPKADTTKEVHVGEGQDGRAVFGRSGLLGGFSHEGDEDGECIEGDFPPQHDGNEDGEHKADPARDDEDPLTKDPDSLLSKKGNKNKRKPRSWRKNQMRQGLQDGEEQYQYGLQQEYGLTGIVKVGGPPPWGAAGTDEDSLEAQYNATREVEKSADAAEQEGEEEKDNSGVQSFMDALNTVSKQVGPDTPPHLKKLATSVEGLEKEPADDLDKLFQVEKAEEAEMAGGRMPLMSNVGLDELGEDDDEDSSEEGIRVGGSFDGNLDFQTRSLLEAKSTVTPEGQGCTANVLLLEYTPNPSQTTTSSSVPFTVKAYCANAGDSRSVLCRNGEAIGLSEDHKPTNPGERARIVASGGTVSAEGRVDSNLNLSRALGDLLYKDKALEPENQRISGVPDVSEERASSLSYQGAGFVLELRRVALQLRVIPEADMEATLVNLYRAYTNACEDNTDGDSFTADLLFAQGAFRDEQAALRVARRILALGQALLIKDRHPPPDSNPAHPQHTRSHGPAATTSASAQHHQTGPGAAHPNPSAGTATGGQPAAGGRTSSGVQGGAETAQSGTAAAGGKQELSSYAFFAKYTYTTECALLAYNFHDITNQLGIFEFFSYKHDHRLVSVTLAYLFYKYQIHHCDMALDLALTLTYLEDLSATELLEFQDGDAFNVICYLAFLAHVFNADRTIRLKDWYNEIGWRHFTTLKKLNAFVFFLFSKVRKFKLQVSESRVKKYIQKLCSVPTKS
eukprot:g490.t1